MTKWVQGKSQFRQKKKHAHMHVSNWLPNFIYLLEIKQGRLDTAAANVGENGSHGIKAILILIDVHCSTNDLELARFLLFGLSFLFRLFWGGGQYQQIDAFDNVKQLLLF